MKRLQAMLLKKKRRLLYTAVGVALSAAFILLATQQLNQRNCSKTMSLTKSSILKSSSLDSYGEAYDKYLKGGSSACTSNVGVIKTDSRVKQQLQYYYLDAAVAYTSGRFDAAKASAAKGLEISNKLSDTNLKQKEVTRAINGLRDIKESKQ